MLGDFYLQSSTMAENKDKAFKGLIQHGVLYLVAMVLVIIPIFSWTMLMYAGVIAVVHFGIDFIKSRLKEKKFMENKKAITYVTDQILHIAVIAIVTCIICNSTNQVEYIDWIASIVNKGQIDVTAIISWLLVVLIIINPVSVTIKTVLNHYRPEQDEEDGLPNAGALIGVLERGIILVLLIVQQYSAIGFVLTAKSVARYNKIAEDPKFSEYYLLGTLLSTLLVIVTYLTIL